MEMKDEMKQELDQTIDQTRELFEIFMNLIDEKKYSSTSIYAFCLMSFVQSALAFNTSEQEFDDSLSRMKELFLIGKNTKI